MNILLKIFDFNYNSYYYIHNNSYCNEDNKMKTIQMTLDEELIIEVDKIVKKLGTTRSAFTRIALKKFVIFIHEKELENKHILGYKNKPIESTEFSIWENEQIWID